MTAKKLPTVGQTVYTAPIHGAPGARVITRATSRFAYDAAGFKYTRDGRVLGFIGQIGTWHATRAEYLLRLQRLVDWRAFQRAVRSRYYMPENITAARLAEIAKELTL